MKKWSLHKSNNNNNPPKFLHLQGNVSCDLAETFTVAVRYPASRQCIDQNESVNHLYVAEAMSSVEYT